MPTITLPRLYTGDDWKLPITITDPADGSAESLVGKTVKYALVSSDDSDATILIAEKTVDTGLSGTVLASGKVVLSYTDAETGALTTYGKLFIEVQVDDGTDITTAQNRKPIFVVKGLVS